ISPEDMNTHSSLSLASEKGAIHPGLLADSQGHVVTGAGAPVVLLHSSLGSKSQWAALAERLAPRYRVIALDLCGYGDNALPAPTASFRLDDEVRLVTDRLDDLVPAGVRFHVVGHSYGRVSCVATRAVPGRPCREPVVVRASRVPHAKRPGRNAGGL